MRFFWDLVCTVIIVQAVRSGVGGQVAQGEKTSQFLKKKFETYNKVVRPFFGEKPVTVTVTGYVLDIFNIDENNQEFTVNLYLRHEWKDPRLEFTESEAGTDKLILNQEYADKIWRVDTFIVNERESKGHALLTENQFTRISADGTVLISTRFTIKASCKMELGWFPFDRHTCPLLIESYGHTTTDFVYQWKPDENGKIQKAIGVSKELSSIQFSIAAVNTRQESISLGPKSYSRLAAEFFFIRASTRFVHEVYLPAVILTLLSFVTLFFATGTPKMRLQISIFVDGILILLMAISAKTMPPVSYQTALDFYLFVSLLTISGVVAINLAICVMVSNANESSTNGVVRLRSVNDESNSIDDDGKEVLFDTGPRFSTRASRLIMVVVKLRLVIPLIFVVFNVLYWMIVLIGSSSFPDDFLILDKNLVE